MRSRGERLFVAGMKILLYTILFVGTAFFWGWRLTE